MYATVIYKETLSPITGTTSKVEIMEIDESEENANKYAKLYSLQLPQDDKQKVIFRPIQIKIN